jgi:hypothetical protein
MNFTVTLQPSPEFLAILQTFAGAMGAPAVKATNGKTSKKELTASTETAVVEDPPFTPDPPKATAVKEISIESLRAAVNAKCPTDDMRKKLKGLLDSMGYKSVSTVPADQRVAFLEKVNAL